VPILRRRFDFTTRTRTDIDADVYDEIAFHLEMRTRELVDRGWSPESARAEARRQFGDLENTAAYCRRLDADKERGMVVRRWTSELSQDLSHGARMLARQPGLSTTLLLTIALGIGAATLVFSVFYASLLAPLPYAHPDRLTVVRLSLPDYADLRESVGAFEEMGVWASNLYMLDDEQVLGGVVSPGLFATLGVEAQLGRVITDSDGAAPVVVLSHGLWQRRFGGDPGILGRTVPLSGEAHTVVGVMPARFRFPSQAFQLWAGMNASMARVPQQAQNRALRIFSAVGLLKPGIGLPQAQAELTALASRLEREYPDTNEGISLTLVRLRDRLVGDARTPLLVALGAVAGLLLIACVNVANLMLARMTTRTQELAVRAALGAGRARLARQLVTESLLVVGCGGALGLLLAGWAVRAVPSLIGGRVPLVADITLTLPVLLIATAYLIACGLLVSLAPIAHLSVGGERSLRGGGRGESDVPFVGRLRAALVVVQITVAVVVLAGGLLLTRSLLRLLDADVGFSTDRVLAFHLLLVDQPGPGARALTAARALEALSALPGVEAAGGATGLAPVTAQRGTAFEVEGRGDAAANQRRAYFVAASPGYFEALTVSILSGRAFAAEDGDAAPAVAILSSSLARRFFPTANDALGRRIRLVNPEYSNEWRTIVGVVSDVRYQGLDDVDPPVLYTPFAQTPFLWMYVHVRTAGDPLAALGSIRAALRSVDPKLTAANPQPLRTLVSESSADPRFRATLITTFAALALILAGIGVHGLVSFGVARKTREIAIRLALGASAASVSWWVIRQALLLATAGALLGLLGARLAASVLTTMLYETTPTDPLALAGVVALLLAVSLAACAVPAWRAMRIEPVEALRES
jgi:predicted permease